jgi:hypothetical protein
VVDAINLKAKQKSLDDFSRSEQERIKRMQRVEECRGGRPHPELEELRKQGYSV